MNKENTGQGNNTEEPLENSVPPINEWNIHMASNEYNDEIKKKKKKGKKLKGKAGKGKKGGWGKWKSKWKKKKAG